jgi:hypothetical protein
MASLTMTLTKILLLKGVNFVDAVREMRPSGITQL